MDSDRAGGCADPAPGGKRPGLRHAVVFHSYCRDAAKRLAYAAIGAVSVLPQRRRAAVEHEGYLPWHDSVRGDAVSGRAAAHRIPDTGYLATKGTWPAGLGPVYTHKTAKEVVMN